MKKSPIQFISSIAVPMVCVLFSSILQAQAPNFSWGQGIYAPSSSYGIASSIAADNDGNSFAVGSQDSGVGAYTEVHFDNGEVLMNEAGPVSFLAKYTSDGNLLWVLEAIAHNGGSFLTAVTFDGIDGVYVAGNAWGDSLSLGDTTFTINYPSYPGKPFVAHCDSDGNIVWLRLFEGDSGLGFISDMVSDESGTAYVSGQLAPGESMFGGITIQPDSLVLSFTAKFNINGDAVWAIPYGSRRLALTSDGGVVLNGPNAGALVIGNDSIDAGNYIARFTSNGDPVWARHFGPVFTGLDNTWYLENGLVCDAQDNVYFSAILYTENLEFLGDTITNPGYAIGNYGFFVSRIDAGGNLTWVNNNVAFPVSLAIDGYGNLLVGSAAYDLQGNLLWDTGCSWYLVDAAVHSNGKVTYAGAQFFPEYDCAGLNLFFPDGLPWSYYYVVLNMDDTALSLDNNRSNEPIVFPNPMSHAAVVDFPRAMQGAKLRLINQLGQTVFADGFSGSRYQLNNRGWSEGNYVLVVEDEKYQFRVKICLSE